MTPRASLFDACHAGVVRVVFWVQAFAGVGAMLPPRILDWLLWFRR
jgi:hypothetical protein